jgi:competence protein ComEC
MVPGERVSRGRLLVSAVLLLGAVRGLILWHLLLAPLPESTDRLLVRACVRTIPVLDGVGWRFNADVSFLRHPQWRSRRLQAQLPFGESGPEVGECWQYAVRLTQPAGAGVRRALLRDHLSGYARVDAGPLTQRISTGGRGLEGLRARLAGHIAGQISDPAAAALLAALAVGATGDINTRQWQVFNATGITHLIAISGMHVTFFALLAMAGARWLWCRLAPCWWLPRRSMFAAVVGSVFALLYALLSGFSVPAQRTVVMLSAFLFMREVARCSPPLWSVIVALIAVLLYDPLAIFAAGLWLSFAAVAAIVLLVGGRLRQSAPLPGLLQLQWIVSLSLLPVTVAIFGTFSIAGLLVNLVAIPVFSFLLVPPVLIATACYLLPGAAAAWCGDVLLHVAGWVAAWLWPALAWCARVPGALWFARPVWSWYLLAVPCVLLALLPVAWRIRICGLGLLGSAFMLQPPRPALGELRLEVLGSGSAHALLVQTHSHLILVGTGEVYGSAGQRFGRNVLPLLHAPGRARIDLWLPGALTRDVQVALGIAAAALPVARVLLPPGQAAPPEMASCVFERWLWDGMEFTVQPSGDVRSCVLIARHGGRSITLDGADQALRTAVIRL